MVQITRRARARLRLLVLSSARWAYRSLENGFLAPVAGLEVVQRLRRRWQHPMDVRDVLEILDLLDSAGVPWWLAGGWGVDALVGQQTRRHKDLDLVVAYDHVHAALDALRPRGFRHRRTSPDGSHRLVPGALMPQRELLQDGATRTVDLHPVEPGTWLEAVGITDPFTTGTIGGRMVGCLSVAAQRAAHRGFELSAEHLVDLHRLDEVTSTLT
jgi:lincosamide nucleotidyltransferase A/C/D/E